MIQLKPLIIVLLCLMSNLSAQAETKKTKVLVVGGAGYIGSTASVYLQDAGYDVHILDDLSTGHRELIQNRPFTIAKAADEKSVQELLMREKFDAVMYFAAKSQVAESVRLPRLYWRNNVDQTKKFLKMMMAAGTKTFIFSSTAATYGNPETELIAETHPQKPINPYGATKLAVERHLQKLAEQEGLRSVALRYFNASGAESKLRVGEWHDPETHLIPLVLQAIKSGNPVKIFGTDYPSKDGTAVRDFIHVTDLVRAHEYALQHLFKSEKSSPGGFFDAFNLGSKNGYTVREVIASAERVTGKKVPAVEAPRRDGDPARLVADSTKAEKILGFKPQLSLDTILKNAWDWENSPFCSRVFKL